MSRIADWPHLFGHIITGTGWSWRQVEALTLHEVNELLEYWSEHPPTHVLLAAMMRARPLRKRKHGDLLSAVAGVGGSVSSAPSRAMKQVMKSEHEGLEGDKKKVTKPNSVTFFVPS